MAGGSSRLAGRSPREAEEHVEDPHRRQTTEEYEKVKAKEASSACAVEGHLTQTSSRVYQLSPPSCPSSLQQEPAQAHEREHQQRNQRKALGDGQRTPGKASGEGAESR